MLLKQRKSPFKWRHFEPTVILLCVRWYCKLRRVKYLNKVIEQDQRAIRRGWRALQCFRSFHTAERTLEGIESLHMMRKGQVKRLDDRDSVGQAKFVESLFGVAA